MTLDIVIVAHHQRPEAAHLTALACEWAMSHGGVVWLPSADAEALGRSDLASDRAPGQAGLALSLGGDGTILRTFDLLDGAPVPVLGVNLGTLGYLTEVEPPAMLASLDRFLGGEYRIEDRMMLEASVERAAPVERAASVERAGAVDAIVGPATSRRWRALNEAVIEKQESGHTVRLALSIDGAPFTTYSADGLIVATPTGSTAYSLSARGPVVSPTQRAMLLTPVSPHMLFDRSLVLGPDEDVLVEVRGHRRADLAIDGRRVASLAQGDTVRCRSAATEARFVRFGERRFHQILKAKFGLTDR